MDDGAAGFDGDILMMLVMVLMSRKLFALFDQMLLGQRPKIHDDLFYRPVEFKLCNRRTTLSS